jgi:hypothetical protein
MEMLAKVFGMAMSGWDFLKSDSGVALIVSLLVISEALGGSNRIKQNSIYQLVIGGLKKLKDMLPIKK